jgi:hypothetical protein
MRVFKYFIGFLLFNPLLVLSNTPSLSESKKEIDAALAMQESFSKWNKVIELVYDHDEAKTKSTEAEFLNLIRKAADEWELVSGVRFSVKADRGIKDDTLEKDGKVRISWIDDPENTWIGRAGLNLGDYEYEVGYSPYKDGIVELNSAKDWDYDADYSIAVLNHELGHILGLGHSDDPVSTMNASWYPRKDDIEITQVMYGPPTTPIDALSPIPEWKFKVPPKASASVTKYLFKPNQAVNKNAYIYFGYQNQVEITKITSDTPDEEYLRFNSGGVGNFNATEDIDQSWGFVLVDPFGYKIAEQKPSPEWKLKCKVGYACGSFTTAGLISFGTMKGFPGDWKLYVLDKASNSPDVNILYEVVIPVDVEVSRNLPPEAIVQMAPGIDNKSVTFTLTASDPENDEIEVVWYSPWMPDSIDEIDGKIDGRLKEKYPKDGKLIRTFNYPELKKFSVFIEIKDGHSFSYGNEGIGLSNGFRKLLRADIIPPPKKAPEFSATKGIYEDKVIITWNKVEDATYYFPWRCWSKTDSNQCGQGPKITDLTYSSTGGAVNTIYYYRLQACNDLGCSELSEPDTGFKKSTEEIKEKTPKQSLSGISTSGGKSSKATIEGGATSDLGKTSKTTFTSGDYIDVVFTIYPEEDHIGDAGYIYVVLSKTTGRNKSFSYLIEDGLWEPWGGGLKALQPARVVDELSEAETVLAYSGEVEEGDLKIYVGYALPFDDKPTIHFNSRPYKIEIVGQ